MTLRQAGYFVSPTRIQPETLELLHTASDAAVRNAQASSRSEHTNRLGLAQDGAAYVRRIEKLWKHDPAFASLLVFEPIVSIAESAIGTTIMPVNAQLVIKGAHENNSLDWHFDPDIAEHPRPSEDYVLAIYLDTSTTDNGAVQVVSGSHRWSLAQRQAWLRNQPQISSHNLPAGAVELNCPRGTIGLHERGILHGSPRNRTPQQRRTIYLHYRSTEFLRATKGPDYVDKLAASLAGLPGLVPVH
ncbi:phytanoyl-CoA dioxygenase family protein [Nocardia sp. NPDC019395]|uniref:phytanoyl-CoA dioxygenase family protein n=1 Tax=Nocardia sp. NPDC019395 TaxID=3154686 RepID=UPI0033DD8644